MSKQNVYVTPLIRPGCANLGKGFGLSFKEESVLIGSVLPSREEQLDSNYITNTGLELSILYPSVHFDEAVIGYLKFRELFPERPMDYVIDIGANAGSVGIFAAQQGARCVLLVEPTWIPRLWFNVYNNHLEERCTILPYAIWKEDGQPLDMLKADPATVSNIPLKPEYHQEAIPTLTLTFNTLVNMLPRVDFMKIDIDGAEYMVLNDSVRSALHKINMLDIEFHIFKGGLQGSCDVSEVLEDGLDSEPQARKIIQMFLDEGFELFARKLNSPASELFASDPVYKYHMLFYRPD